MTVEPASDELIAEIYERIGRSELDWIFEDEALALIARIRQAEADNAKLKQERSVVQRTMRRMRAEAADLRETIANRTRERDAALARIKVMDEALHFIERLADTSKDYEIARTARAARKEPT